MNSDKEYIIKDPDSIFGTQRPPPSYKKPVIIAVVIATCMAVCATVGLTTYFLGFNDSMSDNKGSQSQRQLMGPACTDPCV